MSDSPTEQGEPSIVPSESDQTTTQSQWSRQNIGQFIENHTYKCFFIGTPSLIVGSLLYYTPMHNDLMNLVYISLMLIFIGGILIWIPVFYWMTETTEQSDSQAGQPVCEPIPSPFVARMKPPDYDSLMPPGPQIMVEAPPAYDEIFQDTEHRQASSQNSVNAVTTCEEILAQLHQHGSHSLTNGIPHSYLRDSQTGNSRDVHEPDTQPLLS